MKSYSSAAQVESVPKVRRLRGGSQLKEPEKRTATGRTDMAPRLVEKEPTRLRLLTTSRSEDLIEESPHVREGRRTTAERAAPWLGTPGGVQSSQLQRAPSGGHNHLLPTSPKLQPSKPSPRTGPNRPALV